MNVPMRRYRAGHGRQAYEVRAPGDDAIAWVDALQYLYQAAVANSEFHGTAHKGLAASLHENHGPARIIDDGGFGNNGRPRGGREQQSQENRLIDREAVVAIVGFIDHRNGSGRGVHQLADGDEAIRRTDLAGVWHFDFRAGKLA